MLQDAPSAAPQREYERRLAAGQQNVTALLAQENRVIRGRLFSFAAGLVLAGLVWRFGAPLAWLVLILPVAAFLWFVARHRRLRRKIEEARRAVKYYQRGLDRLRGRWQGVGADGIEFADKPHLYAADLDLFGRGSLFQRIGGATTRQGEHELAQWLLRPAPPTEIVARHGAIRQLQHDLDLREALGILDVAVHDRLDPNQLRRWATGQPNDVLLDNKRRMIAVVISLLALVGLGLWIFGDMGGLPFFAMLGVAIVFLVMLRVPLRKQLDEISTALGSLDQLVNVLRVVERRSFQDARLQQISQRWLVQGHLPSYEVHRLNQLVEQYESFQRNQLLIPVSLTLLLPIHFARRIELWRQQVGSHIPQWLDSLGQLEALCALAGYWFERPQDVLPEIADDAPLFLARQIGHPLIPDQQCVRNDVRLDANRQLIMISGSNMSGKSTMLRAIGVNAVLAQAGAPVCADLLRMSSLEVGTSMRIFDSLQAGTSHFYAELHRLKSIVDRTEGSNPVLFLLDEILHGTNSKDRRIGAEAVLRRLLARRAMGLVTTHDLALTDIAEKMDGRAINVHFADHFENGQMVFDYKMQEGVVRKSNALELMRSLGLEV